MTVLEGDSSLLMKTVHAYDAAERGTPRAPGDIGIIIGSDKMNLHGAKSGCRSPVTMTEVVEALIPVAWSVFCHPIPAANRAPIRVPPRLRWNRPYRGLSLSFLRTYGGKELL